MSNPNIEPTHEQVNSSPETFNFSRATKLATYGKFAITNIISLKNGSVETFKRLGEDYNIVNENGISAGSSVGKYVDTVDKTKKISFFNYIHGNGVIFPNNIDNYEKSMSIVYIPDINQKETSNVQICFPTGGTSYDSRTNTGGKILFQLPISDMTKFKEIIKDNPQFIEDFISGLYKDGESNINDLFSRLPYDQIVFIELDNFLPPVGSSSADITNSIGKSNGIEVIPVNIFQTEQKKTEKIASTNAPNIVINNDWVKQSISYYGTLEKAIADYRQMFANTKNVEYQNLINQLQFVQEHLDRPEFTQIKESIKQKSILDEEKRQEEIKLKQKILNPNKGLLLVGIVKKDGLEKFIQDLHLEIEKEPKESYKQMLQMMEYVQNHLDDPDFKMFR